MSTLPNDMQEIATRMAQYASDFAALWFEFLQLMAGSAGGWPMPAAGGNGTPVSRSPESGTSPAPPPASTPLPTASELTRVRVAVTSPHPAEVSVDLRAPACAGRLVLQSLRAVDPSKPRLSDVEIASPGGKEPVTVRIRVPPGQPAGVYNGLIIEEDTSRPIGTVSLRITSE